MPGLQRYDIGNCSGSYITLERLGQDDFLISSPDIFKRANNLKQTYKDPYQRKHVTTLTMIGNCCRVEGKPYDMSGHSMLLEVRKWT